MKSNEEYLAEIDALSSYEKDWDTYDSDPPNLFAINKAKEYIDFLKYVPFDTMFRASADGGVALYFIGEGNRRGWVEILNEPDEGVDQWLVLYQHKKDAAPSLSLPIHDGHKYCFMEMLKRWLNMEK